MKTNLLLNSTVVCSAMLAVVLLPLAVQGASPSNATYSIMTDALSAGGSRAVSASYSSEGSLGNIGVFPGSAPGGLLARHGFVGQICDVTRLLVNAQPTNVNEGAASQLRASAILDDATWLLLVGSDVTWSVISGPIRSLETGGCAVADHVYQNASATVRGDFLGAFGTLRLTVLNVNSDDFGSYANDGVPDEWQVRFFGVNHPDGRGNADPDGDGQDNRFEYVAGLNPTNQASCFTLRMAAPLGQSTSKNIIFSPVFSNRTYTVQFRKHVDRESFADLQNSVQTNRGLERTVTDLNAVDPMRLYRVQISPP